MLFIMIIVLPFVTGTGCPFPASALSGLFPAVSACGRLIPSIGANLIITVMKSNVFDLCGFCAAVLLGASFVCPGVAVGLAFLAVVPGALWLLGCCDPSGHQDK